MADMAIGRLALELRGLSARDGERLARLVGDGLAASSGALEAPLQVDALRVRGAVAPGTSLERLADQIVAEVMSQLVRML